MFNLFGINAEPVPKPHTSLLGNMQVRAPNRPSREVLNLLGTGNRPTDEELSVLGLGTGNRPTDGELNGLPNQRIEDIRARMSTLQGDTDSSIQTKNTDVEERYKAVVKGEENSMAHSRGGFSGGRWFPHKSPEGGEDTIGWGHKLNGEDIEFEASARNSGLTPASADIIFENDWAKAKEKAESQFTRWYPGLPKADKAKVKTGKNTERVAAWGDLSHKGKVLLTEIAFNVRGGLTTTTDGARRFEWPSLVKAIVKDDKAEMKKHIGRTFTPKGSTEKKTLARVKPLRAFIEDNF